MTTLQSPGFPIRTSADQYLFAAPRSLSQLVTSFVASESQGIRHALLITFSNIILLISLLLISQCQYVKERFRVGFKSLLWTASTVARRSFSRIFFKELIPSYAKASSDEVGGRRWRIRESNPWPPACKAGALANWANSPCKWAQTIRKEKISANLKMSHKSLLFKANLEISKEAQLPFSLSRRVCWTGGDSMQV